MVRPTEDVHMDKCEQSCFPLPRLETGLDKVKL